MKTAHKFLSCVLAFAMMLSCFGINAYAAATDDLAISNFRLEITDTDSTLSVALICDKGVSAWGGSVGYMSITDGNGADASTYFTLNTITNEIGDPNNDTAQKKWSASANDYTAGDTLTAGTWTTYAYTVAESVPDGNYTFTMTFAEGECFDVELNDYSICGQSVSTTYTVGSSGGETPSIPTNVTYTADLSTTSSAVKVGDEVTVNILVGGTSNEFASSELNLTYEGLTFVSGTAAKADGQVSIEGKDGAIKIVDHGQSTIWTEGTLTAYTLNFTVAEILPDTTGIASVTLSNAALSTAANASGSNLTAATVTVATKEFTVTPADLTVTLDEAFTGNSTVAYNGTYTFEAVNKNYTYTISVNDGAYAAVETAEGSGIWTISNVKDNLSITATKNPKTYTITFTNKDHIQNQTTDTVSFVYGTEGGFSFTLKDNVAAGLEAGTTYAVDSIKYTGTDTVVTHTAPETSATTNRTYTLGTVAITGDITITTSATTVNPNQFTVTLPTSTYPELTADKNVVDLNGSVVLTLDPVAGYKYVVSVNGTAIADDAWTATPDENDGDKVTYTISDITANVSVSVSREVDTSKFTVKVMTDYVAMDGQSVHLVRVSGALDEGYVLTYGGSNMYWSTGYATGGEYVYLVITDANTTLTKEDATTKIDIAQGAPVATITYDGNVNLADTTTVDANDAQLVWNMYKANVYSAFATEATGATMEKFLRADMNHDGKIYTEDAAEIIALIKNRTN